MLLRFTKMHGLGNDFMVVDLVTQRLKFNNNMVKRLADRKLGIGFDQLLVVEIPSDPEMDFRYRIFNADGSEVEHCGNGARCFALFVKDKRLTVKNVIHVETAKGKAVLTIRDDRQVEVDMGPPVLAPASIPFVAEREESTYPVDTASLLNLMPSLSTEQIAGLGLSDKFVQISAVSMGNPHGVIVVPNVNTAAVALLGPLLESHPLFPEKANVGFMQIVSESEINLRVYERGAGETLACGTGACAAVVAGRLRGLLAQRVKVNLPGGSLDIIWGGGEYDSVIMTGPATNVFEGKMFI